MGLAPVPTLSALTPLTKPLQPSFLPIRLYPWEENIPEQSGFIVPAPALPGVSKFPAMIEFWTWMAVVASLKIPPPSPLPSLSLSAVLLVIVTLFRFSRGEAGDDTPAVILGAVAAQGHVRQRSRSYILKDIDRAAPGRSLAGMQRYCRKRYRSNSGCRAQVWQWRRQSRQNYPKRCCARYLLG